MMRPTVQLGVQGRMEVLQFCADGLIISSIDYRDKDQCVRAVRRRRKRSEIDRERVGHNCT